MLDFGAFGEALARAFGREGKYGRRVRLHEIVRDELKRGLSETKVLDRLMEITDDDPALVMEIVDQAQMRRALLKKFVERYAAQLRAQGETITVEFPRKRDGGGQSRRDTQCGDAPADQQDSAGNGAASGDGGQSIADTQGNRAATPDDDNDGQDAADPGGDRGGHIGCDTHRRFAPTVTNAPSDDDGAGGGQQAGDTHTGIAPAAPAKNHGHGPQSASRRAAAITARNKSAQSVLSNGSLVSGKPYGDLTKADLRQEVHRADHRGQFARRVLAEAKFWDEDTTPLKRVMAEKQAKSLWDKAWEAVNHAA